MEQDPSNEQRKFQIGRWTPHQFEVYETAETEEEAMRIYRSQVNSVSSPEQIYIFETGGSSPRKDLQEKAEQEK